MRHAEDLAAVLDDVYSIKADVHELHSGNAILSVLPGLLAYTDGESFWWTSPELSNSGAPALSSAVTPPVAAEQISEHYAILRARPAISLLNSELPLLADVILADHVARADREDPTVIPPYGTPASDRLNAITRHSGAITALKNLRIELHTHRIYSEISYDEGLPRLVISSTLTVWTDRAGTVYCWGAGFQEEPADHAPAENLQQVAHQIAGLLGEHYAEPEPVAAP